jgi:RNA polymerase sigma-70 factor (ECF subfamily)
MSRTSDPLVEDQQIMARLAQGETAAIAELYERYGGLVFSLALRIVGDVALAEDLVQEVFVRVWRSAANYRPESGSVRTWLLIIARHRAIDEWRRRRRESAWTGLEAVAIGRRAASEDSLNDPFVYQAMAELPDEQQQVIELAYFYGLTMSEIADRLDLAPGTVKSRMRLAMTKLRARLGAGTEHKT